VISLRYRVSSTGSAIHIFAPQSAMSAYEQIINRTWKCTISLLIGGPPQTYCKPGQAACGVVSRKTPSSEGGSGRLVIVTRTRNQTSTPVRPADSTRYLSSNIGSRRGLAAREPMSWDLSGIGFFRSARNKSLRKKKNEAWW